jgi:hypothetical protein
MIPQVEEMKWEVVRVGQSCWIEFGGRMYEGTKLNDTELDCLTLCTSPIDMTLKETVWVEET